MARFRSALPWGIVALFIVLVFVAWWIEDCVLYYIDWRSLAVGRFSVALAGGLHLDEAFALLGHAVAAFGHAVYFAIATGCNAIAQGFDTLPAEWRSKWPLRLLAWVAGTTTATFGGDALSQFGAGLELTLAQGLKLLIALNGACWLYNLLRRGFDYAALGLKMPIRFYAEREIEANTTSPGVSSEQREAESRSTRPRRREYVQFFGNHVERIGVILAGGGARGAYQAGALKAIYEFLRDYNSLTKVRMIAGTSIGAWNAMFWLADMIEPARADTPTLKTWWKSLSFGSLMDFPWLYIPFWSNSLLRPAPWREQFQELFRKRLDRVFEEDSIHFYFTRSDVEDGSTHYSTNWRNIGQRIDELGLGKDDHNYRYFDVIEAGKDALGQIADAVFGAMGLPPLFPRPRIGESIFEDGARENLPLRFGAPVENCDLLFVLPLDGSKTPADSASTIGRLVHAIDVRKGTLDCLALKSADLINRMAERMERIEFGVSALAPTVPAEGVPADALSGLREEIAEFGQDYRRLYMFAVCPTGQLEVDDFGLWKRSQARDAFDLMYVQTRRELQSRFFEDIEPEGTHVVMVDGALPTGNELPKPKYRRPAQL